MATQGDIAEIKRQIKESLETIRKLGPSGDAEHSASIDMLIAEVDKLNSFGHLFRMQQALRETLAKDLTGKEEAPFKVRTKDGTVITVKNLDEADELHRKGVL